MSGLAVSAPRMKGASTKAGAGAKTKIENNLFIASIADDHIQARLDMLYPQYTVTTLSNLMISEGISGNGVTIYEMGRTRSFNTVADKGDGSPAVEISASDSSQVIITVNEPEQYYLVNDVLKFINGGAKVHFCAPSRL